MQKHNITAHACRIRVLLGKCAEAVYLRASVEKQGIDGQVCRIMIVLETYAEA